LSAGHAKAEVVGFVAAAVAVAINGRLAAEWHEDNPPPDTIALGNGGRHKWRCVDADCGHVWEARPSHRSSYGNNCPECAQKRNGKVKCGSLAEVRPDLAAEWDEKRNGSQATSLTCGSNKSVHWVCVGCGDSWKTTISSRARLGSGCPKCREVYRRQPRQLIKAAKKNC